MHDTKSEVFKHAHELCDIGLDIPPIAYFTKENDSVTMTDFRIYLDKAAAQTPLEELAKFGLYDSFTTFQLEELNKKSLILTSDKVRIVMQKY